MINPHLHLSYVQNLWSIAWVRKALGMAAITLVLSGFAAPDEKPDEKLGERPIGSQEATLSSVDSVLRLESGPNSSTGALLAHVMNLGEKPAESQPAPLPEVLIVPTSIVPPVPSSSSSQRTTRPTRSEPIDEAPVTTGEVPIEVAVAEGIEEPVPAEPEGPGEFLGTFSVTCYALDGTTASGEPVNEGGVAVDRRMIPFGTRIYIENVGWRVANDTGGSVRGNRLDIWLPNRDDCIAFGHQKLNVYAE